MAVAHLSAKTKSADLRRSTSDPASRVTSRRPNTFMHLQRAIGNRAVNSLLSSPVIQPKLTISQPDDEYEREADRVADQVMRMPDSRSYVTSHHTQPAIQRFCTECEEEGETIQAKELSGHTPEVTADVQAQINGLRGSGQPLPDSVRAFFEPRFGSNFSRIRIHTDSKAAQSALAINARAYTVGQQIVFGSGQYAPATAQGKKLLAHELVHSIQQSNAATLRRSPQPELECGSEEVCFPDPEDRPLIHRAGGGKNFRNCRPAVGHAQKLLNRFFGSGGIERCESLHDKLRQDRGGALPRDADRRFLINSGKTNTPLKLDCSFGVLTQAVTKGFQAAVFEDPAEWDGKIGDKTWSAIDDFNTTGECPFRVMGEAPTNSLGLQFPNGAPKAGSCGEVAWTNNWELSKPSKAGGHVVQHAVTVRKIEDCNGHDITLDFHGKTKDEFWEAWPINANSNIVSTLDRCNLSFDDLFSYPDRSKKDDKDIETSGKVEFTGDASFFEGLTALPAEFKRNNPDTLAGCLPSTASDPGLTGGTANVDHDLIIEWKCCGEKQSTRVTHHSP